MTSKLAKVLSSTQQIHYYTLLLFCFCLPLLSQGAVLAIIVMAVNSFLGGSFFKNIKQLFHPLSILFISLYIVYLIGLIYTEDMAEGFRDVETKLALLIFPVFIFTAPELKQEQRNRIMVAFVVACFFAILYGIGLTVYYNFWTDLLNIRFVDFTGTHSSYFCVYIGMGIFFLAQQLAPKKKSVLALKQKVLYTSLLLIFVTTIFFLYAKMGFLTLTFLFPVFYLRYKIQRKEYIDGIVRSVIALCLVGTIAWVLPSTRALIFGKVNIPNVSMEKDEQPDVRISIWSASWETAKQQLVFGHGTGDVHVELLKTYKERNFRLGLIQKFNPHNQYLQTTIALGLVGLLFLLGSFILAMYLAKESQHYFYLFFVILFGIACLTESMLEMEKGVLFYAFFNSFFAAELIDKKH